MTHRETLKRLLTPDTLNDEGAQRELYRALKRVLQKPQRVAVWDDGYESHDTAEAWEWFCVGNQTDEEITRALSAVTASSTYGKLIGVFDIYEGDFRDSSGGERRAPKPIGAWANTGSLGTYTYPEVFYPFLDDIKADWATKEFKLGTGPYQSWVALYIRDYLVGAVSGSRAPSGTTRIETRMTQAKDAQMNLEHIALDRVINAHLRTRLAL